MNPNENLQMQNLQPDEIEIDLMALLAALRERLLLLILSGLAAAILAYLVTTLFITPTYDSTTKIYVLNKQDGSNTTITYSDLQSSTQLTKDYVELVTTRPVLEEVISSLSLQDMTYNKLVQKVTASTETDGRIISITVTDKDPQLARDIANEVRNSVSAQIIKVMNVEAVNVVEMANLPEEKARPNTMRNVVIAALLGLFLAAAVVVVQTILDDRIKTAEDVESYLNLSVLGTLPLEEHEKKKTMKKPKSAEKKKAKTALKRK